MDPKACLGNVVESLIEGDHETALDQLDDYCRWRKMSGFEPYPGADLEASSLYNRAFALRDASNAA